MFRGNRSHSDFFVKFPFYDSCFYETTCKFSLIAWLDFKFFGITFIIFVRLGYFSVHLWTADKFYLPKAAKLAVTTLSWLGIMGLDWFSQNLLFLAPEVQWASKFTVFVRFTFPSNVANDARRDFLSQLWYWVCWAVLNSYLPALKSCRAERDEPIESSFKTGLGYDETLPLLGLLHGIALSIYAS